MKKKIWTLNVQTQANCIGRHVARRVVAVVLSAFENATETRYGGIAKGFDWLYSKEKKKKTTKPFPLKINAVNECANVALAVCFQHFNSILQTVFAQNRFFLLFVKCKFIRLEGMCSTHSAKAQ